MSSGRVVVGILVGVLAAAGCATESPAPGGGGPTGSVALALQLGSGVTLSSAAWSITGPASFSRTGTIDVRNSATISATIGNIPVGAGYTIVITATASDGATTCQGTAQFTVGPGNTRVMVHLRCLEPPRTGSVQVRGTLNVCPVIDGLSASPDEVLVGGTIALQAVAHDTDGGPAALTYAWTASSGAFSGPTGQTATFVCAAAGTATVTLTVRDGDCGDSRSLTVTCTAPTTSVVRINEVESNGGTPGDWVELVNDGTAPADVSSWVFKDSEDVHAYVLPAGTVIPAAGHLVLDEAAIGFSLGAGDAARLFDANGALVDSYAWTAHAATSYGRCPNGSGAFATTGTTTKGAPNDCTPAMDAGAPEDAPAGDATPDASPPDGGATTTVVINEVESNGGVPGDWVELFNRGAGAIDVSGWVVKDNDDTHVYTIPTGTAVAPGAYLLIEEAAMNFGLGTADSARLFDANGALVDSYSWTAHANPTYGRCPNATGDFVTTASTTKGAANDCSGGSGPPDGGTDLPPVIGDPWPGTNTVVTVDEVNAFPANLSGLTYQAAGAGAPAVLWAVVNSPATLHKLVWNGTTWTPSADGWAGGKSLTYPDGVGNPDSEGVTLAETGSSAIYVAAERNNSASSISRLSVLRYDTSAAGSTLTATREWTLTADLPAVGQNLGFETITWVPDAHLVASGFRDDRLNQPYDPASYPNHGGGLFLLGVEASGQLHAYALDHVGGGFHRVASFTSGHPGVMGAEFDRDTGTLWAACDDTCAGRTNLLRIDTTPGSPTLGRFTVRRELARASSMPNVNNEGVALAPESECVGGLKSIFWSDDGNTGGHALRRDLIPCGAL